MHTLTLQNQLWTITVPANEHYVIHDHFNGTEGKKTINIEAWATLSYLCIMNDAKVDITIETKGEKSEADVHGVFITQEGKDVHSRFVTNLNTSHSKSDMKLTSFLCENSHLKLHGGVILGKNIIKGEWYLSEKNVILGKNISTDILPMLDVHSNDVMASHGASIDTINDNRLFYMQAKGLTTQSARTLIIQWYINSIIDHFDAFNEDYREGLKSSLISSILK